MTIVVRIDAAYLPTLTWRFRSLARVNYLPLSLPGIDHLRPYFEQLILCNLYIVKFKTRLEARKVHISSTYKHDSTKSDALARI